MPIVNTVGLANLELDSEERAPNIVDFAFCIRGAHEGAVYAPSYRRPQCTCGSFDCCLHGFSHACVDDWEECSAYAMFYENSSVCPAAHTEKHGDSLPFLLVRELSSTSWCPPEITVHETCARPHLCEQKTCLGSFLHSPRRLQTWRRPSRQEAIATMLKYYKRGGFISHYSFLLQLAYQYKRDWFQRTRSRSF